MRIHYKAYCIVEQDTGRVVCQNKFGHYVLIREKDAQNIVMYKNRKEISNAILNEIKVRYGDELGHLVLQAIYVNIKDNHARGQIEFDYPEPDKEKIGVWLWKADEDGVMQNTCSECGYCVGRNTYITCPSCGAIMRAR